MQILTAHQFGTLVMIGCAQSVARPSSVAFMVDYGTAFRAFKHGASHGFLSKLFLALSNIGTNALIEKRSSKYALVTGGLWIVCCTIMGGVICDWQ